MRGLGVYKGFDKSRDHGWFLSVKQADGSRPKQYFADAKARDRAFNAKVLEIRNVGADASQVGPADRQTIAEMNRLAASTGLTPLEIFNRGLAQLGGITIGKLTCAQAYELFLVEQTARNADGKISGVRLKEIKNTLTRWLKRSGGVAAASYSRSAVKAYLGGLDVGPQTRVNHARILSFFFNWCVAEGLRFNNPVPEQEGVTRIPTTFTNEQVAELLDCAQEHYPALLPMLRVQWFAGLRPGASHHLTWEDVDFDRARILIHPHGNKLRQPDIVKDLPLAVFAGLLPLRGAGAITPANHIEMNKELHRKLGYGGPPLRRWPEDVARHTFASNLYAFYEQDEKRVQNVMLHATSEMLKRHYLLKNIQPERAAAYFARYLPSA